MLFLIALLVALVITGLFHKQIKKNPIIFYIIAIILSAGAALVELNLPAWANKYILDLFRRGALGTAFFVLVMYAGAIKPSKAKQVLMSIRAELSIIASILVLSHNIFYGKTYFVSMFTDPSGLSSNQFIAGIISIILIAIMIPLFITSFKPIRKGMKARTWKKLQSLAYIFYAGIYLHVAIIIYPFVRAGRPNYIFSLIVYSLVFGIYGVMRVGRTKWELSKKRLAQIAVALPITIICILAIYNKMGLEEQASLQNEKTEEVSQEETPA